MKGLRKQPMALEDDELRRLSDGLLGDAEELERAEIERRHASPGSARFSDLSNQERHVAEELLKKATGSTDSEDRRDA